MSDNKDTTGGAPFVEYAPKWIFVAAGAIVVASMALKVVGVDFEPVFDAWAESIILEMHRTVEVECVQDIPMVDLSPRIEALEAVSHNAG